ncbi:MAG TPA: Gfo/Idh/MocA family oxidoreductase [Burkholderiaceae bacterium]|nr:Gfo/Idh/MocA family oxidoreductase [Burkholderiaceae bacterium]
MINIGVIGYGYWGPNLVRNFAEVPGACMSAVADLDESRLAAARKRYPVKTTTDFNELLDDDNIHAIAIATPVTTHFALALAALRAGKHVWLEKPMTETVEQARILVDEAERLGRILLVDHTFIYTGAVRKMAELMGAGEMGRILYYDSVRVNLGLFQRDVSVISDLAVHDFSILDYLLKEQPVAVTASGTHHFPGTPENLAYVTLFYDSETIAHINVSWLAPVKVRQILLGGSKKMITYDDLEPSEKIKVYDKGVNMTDDPARIQEMRVGYRIGDMWAPKLSVAEALRVEGEHFIECILQGRPPATDGQLGMRVVELIEAANKSMRNRGEIVELRTREMAA